MYVPLPWVKWLNCVSGGGGGPGNLDVSCLQFFSCYLAASPASQLSECWPCLKDLLKVPIPAHPSLTPENCYKILVLSSTFSLFVKLFRKSDDVCENFGKDNALYIFVGVVTFLPTFTYAEAIPSSKIRRLKSRSCFLLLLILVSRTVMYSILWRSPLGWEPLIITDSLCAAMSKAG
jgi:hypothetical protein